jgi:hypothetical protein
MTLADTIHELQKSKWSFCKIEKNRALFVKYSNKKLQQMYIVVDDIDVSLQRRCSDISSAWVSKLFDIFRFTVFFLL